MDSSTQAQNNANTTLNLTAHPAALLEELPAPDFKVEIPRGNIVPARKQVFLRFFIRGKVFEENLWSCLQAALCSDACHFGSGQQHRQFPGHNTPSPLHERKVYKTHRSDTDTEDGHPATPTSVCTSDHRTKHWRNH